MQVTLNMDAIGSFLIGLGLLILIVVLIILGIKLISVVKRLDSVLEDCNYITGVAAKETKEIEGVVDNVSGSVNEIVEACKGNQDIKKAFAVLVNTFSTIKGFFAKRKKKQED